MQRSSLTSYRAAQTCMIAFSWRWTSTLAQGVQLSPFFCVDALSLFQTITARQHHWYEILNKYCLTAERHHRVLATDSES
jgi:hypothetical protein